MQLLVINNEALTAEYREQYLAAFAIIILGPRILLWELQYDYEEKSNFNMHHSHLFINISLQKVIKSGREFEGKWLLPRSKFAKYF